MAGEWARWERCRHLVLVCRVMFGFVEQISYDCRSLYALGLIALLFIAYWCQTQPETERYQLIEKT